MESTLDELLGKYRETTALVEKTERAAVRYPESLTLRHNLSSLKKLQFVLESDLKLFPIERLVNRGVDLAFFTA